jgi:hypothetical protein
MMQNPAPGMKRLERLSGQLATNRTITSTGIVCTVASIIDFTGTHGWQLRAYFATPSNTTYTLDAIPPSSFVSGDWSVQGPGGKDIAAFRADLRIPPSLHWTNRAAISPVFPQSRPDSDMGPHGLHGSRMDAR